MAKLKDRVLIVTLMTIFISSFSAEAKRGLNVRPVSPFGSEVKGDQWLLVIGGFVVLRNTQNLKKH